MTDDLLRQVIAAGLLQIAQRLDRIEAAIAHHNFVADESDDHATVEQELTSALRDFFGGAPFTSSTVLMAGEERGTLQEILAGVIDYNQTPHARAVQAGGVRCSGGCGRQTGGCEWVGWRCRQLPRHSYVLPKTLRQARRMSDFLTLDRVIEFVLLYFSIA